MDESDSDSDGDAAPKKGLSVAVPDDDDDDHNKYPVDGLFASHDEKEEIMNMREVDREQILAERAQEKDRIHQNKLLRQLVSNDEQRKKRSASAADLDDGQRKTSRVRTKVGGTKVGESHSAMDTLKTRRAEKSERNRRREEDRERRKDRPSSRDNRDDSGDDYHDDDGDSDVEWAKPSRKSRSPDPKSAQVTELRDVERVRLSRSRFGQVCFYPGFEGAIVGTFVRISIGPDPETREPVYRMAAVKGKSDIWKRQGLMLALYNPLTIQAFQRESRMLLPARRVRTLSPSSTSSQPMERHRESGRFLPAPTAHSQRYVMQ